MTAQTTRLYTLCVLALCGVLFWPGASAQDESSGDDAAEEVFMDSGGKEEIMEYRLHDESDKGLQDFYVDYSASETNDSDDDDIDDDTRTLDDDSDDDAVLEVDPEDISEDEDYASGEGEVNYRLTLENLLQPDEDEVNETVIYNDNVPPRLISLLGIEDHIGHISRGVKSPGPNTFIPTLEFEDEFLRRIKKSKRRKKNKVSFPKGALTGFMRNDPWSKTTKIAENCDRGYTKDNNKCANSCRVNFLYNGGKHHGLRNPGQLYAKTPQYARCEACGLWSGFFKSHSWFQKQLGNLKGSSPMFCDPINDAKCKEKELVFAACHGTAICAGDCWAPGASEKACSDCHNKYCTAQGTYWNWKVANEKFLLCTQFKKCRLAYPPSSYATADEKTKFRGQAKCWGSPLDKRRFQDVPKIELMDQKKVCMEANRVSQTYPDWKQYFDNCTSVICDVDHKDSNPTFCERLHCKKECLNNNGVSEGCLACDRCKACPLKSLAKTGTFDRKKFKGQVNPVVKEVGTFNKDDPYVRQALVPMTPFQRSKLRKGSCRICDHFQFQLDCRKSCLDYEKFRMQGAARDEKAYKLAFDTCKSTKCYRVFSKACGRCLKRCEKKSQLSWTSMLGNSYWRANYEGYGCAKDCQPKTISTYAEYRGVNIFDAEVANYTRAFDNLLWDNIDDETIDTLKKWRKQGQKLF